MSDNANDIPIPSSYWGYVKSFGRGIVVALTWLGAGELADIPRDIGVVDSPN